MHTSMASMLYNVLEEHTSSMTDSNEVTLPLTEDRSKIVYYGQKIVSSIT